MNGKANKLIKSLKLLKHKEGGYYREVIRAKEQITLLPGRYTGKRDLYSSIYYMLEGDDFSSFHRLKSDELWHFYEGSAFNIYTIEKNGNTSTVKLGSNVSLGEKFQTLVRNGLWFAAELSDKTSYGLAGCTVVPGFEYDDLEIGIQKELISEFPLHKELITRLSRT